MQQKTKKNKKATTAKTIENKIMNSKIEIILTVERERGRDRQTDRQRQTERQ